MSSRARVLNDETIAPMDSEDDDYVDDGLGPSYDLSSGPSLNPEERDVAQKYVRVSAGQETEIEQEPLQAMQKVVTNGKELMSTKKFMLDPGVEAMCVGVNNAGDTIAIGCRNNKLQLVSAGNLQPMDLIDLSKGVAGTITALAYRPDTAATQNVALVAQSDSIITVHTSTGKVMSRRPEAANKINCIDLRKDGSALATAGSDTKVRVYDESRGQLSMVLDHGDDISTTGHSNSVFSLAWSPDDPQMIVSGGWDRSVKVWDLRMRRVARSIFGPYICGDSLSIRYGRLLTGSWRHGTPLQQWDLASCKLMTNMPFHQPEHEACLIYSAKFGTGVFDGYTFAGGSGKQPCFRMHKARGEVVGTLKLHSSMVSQAHVASQKAKGVVLCCTDRIVMVDL